MTRTFGEMQGDINFNGIYVAIQQVLDNPNQRTGNNIIIVGQICTNIVFRLGNDTSILSPPVVAFSVI